MIRALQGFSRSLPDPFPLSEDPPPVTPYQMIYEAGKVRLRHYPAAGEPHATPLLMVYALLKRPFLLDLQSGHSVVETFTSQGFELYFVDWVPPTQAESWRGFAAYVCGDLAQAVRTVQARTGAERVSLFGYSLGGLLTAIYAALYPGQVKTLITLSFPVDLGVPEMALSTLLSRLYPETVDLITAIYGNHPAWLLKIGLGSVVLLQQRLDKYVALQRHGELEDYIRVGARFHRWLQSDVPLAGQLARELTRDLMQKNLFAHSRLIVGGRMVNLKDITYPVLNIVGRYDDLIPLPPACPLPSWSGVPINAPVFSPPVISALWWAVLLIRNSGPGPASGSRSAAGDGEGLRGEDRSEYNGDETMRFPSPRQGSLVPAARTRDPAALTTDCCSRALLSPRRLFPLCNPTTRYQAKAGVLRLLSRPRAFFYPRGRRIALWSMQPPLSQKLQAFVMVR
jgi:class III poly(R)-hydroxyalkanoic acid synthase PhaC subunit